MFKVFSYILLAGALFYVQAIQSRVREAGYKRQSACQ